MLTPCHPPLPSWDAHCMMMSWHTVFGLDITSNRKPWWQIQFYITSCLKLKMKFFHTLQDQKLQLLNWDSQTVSALNQGQQELHRSSKHEISVLWFSFTVQTSRIVLRLLLETPWKTVSKTKISFLNSSQVPVKSSSTWFSKAHAAFQGHRNIWCY